MLFEDLLKLHDLGLARELLASSAYAGEEPFREYDFVLHRDTIHVVGASVLECRF
jgi:hypothetical protein